METYNILFNEAFGNGELSLQRLGSNYGKDYRSAFATLSRAFSTADSLMELKPGKVSGIPQELLRRKLMSLADNHELCRTLSTADETWTHKLERIDEEIQDLNKIEHHDYVILLRHKMGLSRYGPTTSLPSPQSSSIVKLDKFDSAAKLKVIRAFADFGLKEAKDLVEKTPAVVKKWVTIDEVEKILQKFKEVGTTLVFE